MSILRYRQWAKRDFVPIIGLPNRHTRPRGFIQISFNELRKALLYVYDGNKKKYKASRKPGFKRPLETIHIRSAFDGRALDELIGENSEYRRIKAFICFLAYRSAGNPKRLNELLASFMVSADRAVPDPNARQEGFNCQDVLYLPDHKVLRIQFIARVYSHLRKGFQDKIRGRDDKTIVSLIYVSDFLFKFHNRAFSRESLELMDELVHMHRGHDLRNLTHELLDHYSGRYLHTIVNGLYTYRFRSYTTNEIDYLSRHSEEELAAFNFTLDESQTLREQLKQLLIEDKASDQSDKRTQTDILVMLAELHEFYQEYEMARYY